jgi:hypothetical protein
MFIKQLFSQNAHWQLNKEFARKYGLETALLLSDLVDKWIYFDCQEYFFNTSDNIEQDTTLSYRKQKKALDILIKNNFIETKLQGVPATLHFKINEKEILNIFLKGSKNKDFNIGKTSFSETSKLDLAKRKTNKNKINNNKEINKVYSASDKSDTQNTNLNFDKLKDYLNKQTKREGANKLRVINESVKRKYKARLKEGYTKTDISNAIKNACLSKHHKDNNYQYLTLEFFSRSDILDKYGFIGNPNKHKVSKENFISNAYHDE